MDELRFDVPRALVVLGHWRSAGPGASPAKPQRDESSEATAGELVARMRESGSDQSTPRWQPILRNLPAPARSRPGPP